jgi:phage portal protein BeeE
MLGIQRATGSQLDRRSLTVDDVAEFFRFGGAYYPLINTSYGQLSEENIGATLNQVARSNGIVFALMLARMQVFSQARFQWTRFERGAPGDLFGSQDLAVLERPWPNGTTADLLARMEVDVTTAGNAYVRRLRRDGSDRLVLLRPQWMYVVLGSEEEVDHPAEAADVELLGYAYKPPNGEMRTFFPEQIAHYAPMPDPDAAYLGMSWITPAIRDVSADSLMTDHKRAFMRNAATPNVVIRFDPSVTLDAVKKFKEVFEAEHKGWENAYKTLFLGGGADATVIGKDFQQLEFSVTQGKGESRLASSAGVPPSWVGFSEGLQGSSLNAGNFTAARRRFGDGTMQHLWTNVAASLQTIVQPPDVGTNLWFATKGIPFLHMDAKDAAEVAFQEAQTMTALIREGFTAQSVVAAMQADDWSRLVHSGLVSVQLQPPGSAPSTPNGNGDQEGARAALLGGNTR